MPIIRRNDVPALTDAVLRQLQLGITATRPLLKRFTPVALHEDLGRYGRALMRLCEPAARSSFEPGWHALQVPRIRVAGASGPVALVASTLQAGGAERQFSYVAAGLKRRGHHAVSYVFETDQKSGQDFFAHQFKEDALRQPCRIGDALDRLRDRHGEARLEMLVRSLDWAPADHAQAILRLTDEFDRLSPLAVVGWQDETGLAAAFAALIAGVPRAVVATRNLNPSHFEYRREFMAAAYKRLSREPRVVFVNNSSAGARDYECWLGLEPGRFVVVRNGIDVSAFVRPTPVERVGARAVLGIPDDAPVVGGIFRLAPEKQPLAWIDAAREILERRPDTWFVHAGSGPMARRFERYARRRGLRSRLLCMQQVTSPETIMAAFDLMMLASAQEGTPNVVLEAGLMGIPSVAPDVGGVRECILEGVTGRVVPNLEGNGGRSLSSSLADCALDVLADTSGLRQTASDHGPDFISCTFGLERMLDEMELAMGIGSHAAEPSIHASVRTS